MNLKELLGDSFKEGMTFEEIETVLAGIELNTGEDTIKHLKDALSKSNSEASKYKKELRAKLSEEEKIKQAESEARQALEEKYNQLLRETNISKNKAELLGLGYDEKLAEETATAMLDGDLTKVFKNQRIFQESLAKKIKADVLKGVPKPTPDGGTNVMTLDKFRKLSPEEQDNFYTSHPEEFKQLFGGN